jgi:hypothetical protein
MPWTMAVFKHPEVRAWKQSQVSTWLEIQFGSRMHPDILFLCTSFQEKGTFFMSRLKKTNSDFPI